MRFKENYLAEINRKKSQAEINATNAQLEGERLKTIRSANRARFEAEEARQKAKFFEFLQSTPIPQLMHDAKDVIPGVELNESTRGGLNLQSWQEGELKIERFSQQYDFEWTDYEVSFNNDLSISVHVQDDGAVTFRFGGPADCDDRFQQRRTINYRSWSQNPSLLDNTLLHAIHHPTKHHQVNIVSSPF